MRRAALVAVSVAASVLTACGGGNLVMTNGIRVDAAKQLQADVLTLTTAAAAKNWGGARTALSTLRADLDASVSAGAISASRATAIKATADQIAGQLPPVVTSTPTPTSSAPAVRSVAPAPPPAKHHGHDGGDGGDG